MDSQWQVKRSVYNTGPGKEKTEGLEIQEPVSLIHVVELHPYKKFLWLEVYSQQHGMDMDRSVSLEIIG